jgi:hypothetical protein
MFKLSFTTGTVRCIYVPEDAVYNCVKFKKHFDKQEQDERMTLLASQKTWKDLMRKIVLMYPSLPVTRKMYFVENVGFQVSTANYKDPSTWMWVYGPDLHFDASGRQLREDEKTHFWYPSLSNKLGEDVQDKFTALEFKPDPSYDLTVLLEAFRVPQTWSCLLASAIYLSGTASWFVRKVTKQYPVVSKTI